jgi:hypothetical protein
VTSFVGHHAGIEVRDAGLLPGLALTDLFDLALRVNPKRPHLLVSWPSTFPPTHGSSVAAGFCSGCGSVSSWAGRPSIRRSPPSWVECCVTAPIRRHLRISWGQN